MTSPASIWRATGLGLAALFLVLRFSSPAAVPGPDLCLFHRLTGLACPACGLTRAASAFAKGDLGAAVDWHPLLPLLAIQAALLWLAWGWAMKRRGSAAPLARLATRLALANGLLLLLVWALRFARGTLPA